MGKPSDTYESGTFCFGDKSMTEQPVSSESQDPIEIVEHVSRMSLTERSDLLAEDLRLLMGVISEWKNSGVQLMNALGEAIDSDVAEERYATHRMYAALRVHFRELQEILSWWEQDEGYETSFASIEPEEEQLSEIIIQWIMPLTPQMLLSRLRDRQ